MDCDILLAGHIFARCRSRRAKIEQYVYVYDWSVPVHVPHACPLLCVDYRHKRSGDFWLVRRHAEQWHGELCFCEEALV